MSTETLQSTPATRRKRYTQIAEIPAISCYRGYKLRKNKARDNFTCTYLFKHSNYHMPRSFVWGPSIHFNELQQFIDVLTQRQILEVKKFEEMGLATALEYEQPPEDVPIINISAQRLLAILRGEDTLSVPATAKIRFMESSGQHYPLEVFAELAGESTLGPYIETVLERIAEGRPVFCFGKVPSFVDPKRIQVVPSDVQLHQAEQMTARTDEYLEPVEAPPEEIIVKEAELPSHNETVSLLTRAGEAPYYTRRLLTKKGDLLWCGTSYHIQGPWTEYNRDKTRLEALGVTP